MLATHFGGNASNFSPLTSAAAAHHAFNLAAFRSPGFLGPHGFAFSAAANIGNYRDHSPDLQFTEHHSGPPNQHSNLLSASVQQHNYATNSNSPTTITTTNNNNHSNPNQYSPARSNSPARDSYLNSDYYHNNNTTTASAIKAAIESHHNNSNSDYLASERIDRLTSNSNSTNNNNSTVNLNNNHHNHQQHHHHYHSSGGRRINFDRASSESPETQRCDSSRSFAASQKSDEAGYNSPNHPDSVGSHSPENLTASTKKSNKNMLDHHKLPLSFLGPPLAALHSMTEMKSAAANNLNASNANNNIQQTQSTLSPHGTANPHGIDTILSRPPPVTSAGLSALTSGESILTSIFFLLIFFVYPIIIINEN